MSSARATSRTALGRSTTPSSAVRCWQRCRLAGDDWTAETEAAWTDALGIVSGAMLVGAEDSSLEAAA